MMTSITPKGSLAICTTKKRNGWNRRKVMTMKEEDVDFRYDQDEGSDGGLEVDKDGDHFMKKEGKGKTTEV